MSDTSHAVRGLQHDRLELLLFHLEGVQRFGINVLKVKEIIPAPRLTRMPHAHPAVCGLAHLRNEPLSVIDLSLAIGRHSLAGAGASIIITEFNRTMQGFLVRQVDRIAICDWKAVVPPPLGSGTSSYITGVTRIDDELVQILDVERILGEVVALEITGSALERRPGLSDRIVLVVDDSVTARHQTAQTLDAIGVGHVMARDGREALNMLRARLDEQGEAGRVDMIISDIEMPEMDGYTLAREIRNDPRLASLYLLLHTSLNGAINAELAHKAGANDVLTKFVPEELAKAVLKGLGH